MKLHVIGCHGPYPCANGATTGYLVENEGQYLLMDCGSGVLGRLMGIMDPACLSGVLLSHLHFDHACDMLVLRYYMERAGKTLPVWMPEEDHSPLRDMLTAPAFRVEPFPDTLSLAGLTITTLPVNHPVPCRAIRLTDGEKTLVFTGDTNLCEGLEEFCRGADMLLADSAFLSSEWKETLPHMCARQVAELARDAGVKRLYLTHLPVRHAPETLLMEAREIFPGAEAARPGLDIAL